MRKSNTALQITEHIEDQSEVVTEKTNNSVELAVLHTLPFKYDEATDEALVELYVNGGCELAFTQIVSRYTNIIMGFAIKLCRNTHDAEDIKQDVLLILATKLHTYKGTSKFSTWLYRVTLNTCYKYLKVSNNKAKKETNLDDHIPSLFSTEANWAKAPDEILHSKEKMEIIGNAVDKLNESNKQIFNLKEIHGFSNAEVGEYMGLSLSAVKSRVLRTRTAIKDKISGHI